MNNVDEKKYQHSKNYTKALRKISTILKLKIHQRAEFIFYKLRHIFLSESPQFMVLKGTEIGKRLSKLSMLKMRQYWMILCNNLALIELQKKEKSIALTKLKNRVYEAKVKSLRVMTRQWKQKKSQTEYKSKYFAPKESQTPKQIKEKVAQQFYLTLRNILRIKYLTVFNVIKTTMVIKIRNSKALYLVNYLLSKRRYWLTYGHQKLKMNALKNREEKHQEEIENLDTRLVPVQDSQIQNLREKQEKLQHALDTVSKEKEGVVEDVEKEIGEIEKAIEGKMNQVKQLAEKKESLLKKIEQTSSQTSSYELSREEIFFYIYKNFLTNLKLWSQQSSLIDEENIYLTKSLVLEWLQCPVIDFNLDKISLNQDAELDEIIENLECLVKEYKRLKGNEMSIDMNEVFQGFFSGWSGNQCSSFQELFTKTKLTSKIILEVIKENQQIMASMLNSIQNSYQKLLQSEEFQVLQS